MITNSFCLFTALCGTLIWSIRSFFLYHSKICPIGHLPLIAICLV
jgi:hypothetical protein